MPRARAREVVADADAPVLQRLAALIQRAVDDPSLELEARLGAVSREGHFVPGVSRAHMDRLIRSLDLLCAASPDALREAHPAWTEEEDYHYAHPTTKRKLRTRVGVGADDEVTQVTVQKTRLDAVVLRSRVMDVRVALSREAPVDHPVGLVHTSHVRIKQRRSYVAHAPFVFECALTSSGTTRTEAETAQTSSEPCFEVECEVHAQGRGAWAQRRGGTTRAAKSLLTKVANLMLTTGVRFEAA